MTHQTFQRRSVLLGSLFISLIALAPSALAQRGPDQVPVEELMRPGDLPDIVIGKADAPITIVEYASMTCPHCASFHNDVYPKVKAKYIDTGKAKLVYRDYPLDDRARAASMLARCVGGEGPAGMIGELFKRQREWAFVRNPVPVLFEIAKQAGFTQKSFDKCLTNQKLLDNITRGAKYASEKFGVNQTPTFFINGKRLRGGSVADFENAIDPLLTQ